MTSAPNFADLAVSGLIGGIGVVLMMQAYAGARGKKSDLGELPGGVLSYALVACLGLSGLLLAFALRLLDNRQDWLPFAWIFLVISAVGSFALFRKSTLYAMILILSILGIWALAFLTWGPSS